MTRVSAPLSPRCWNTASRLTASKYSSNLTRSRPPSAPTNSFDHSLQVRTLIASHCISPNLLDHSLHVRTLIACNWISPNSFKERRKRVKGYQGISGLDQPYKLRGSMKAPQGCVRPRAGKERVGISYNGMMSVYPGISQLYTPCPWVHLCIYIERLA